MAWPTKTMVVAYKRDLEFFDSLITVPAHIADRWLSGELPPCEPGAQIIGIRLAGVALP